MTCLIAPYTEELERARFYFVFIEPLIEFTHNLNDIFKQSLSNIAHGILRNIGEED